jgi:hypothetical protein
VQGVELEELGVGLQVARGVGAGCGAGSAGKIWAVVGRGGEVGGYVVGGLGDGGEVGFEAVLVELLGGGVG